MKITTVPNVNHLKPKKRPKRLRFTPTAWAKLRFLRDLGDTEVGGFGIASEEDLFLVEDVRLVAQECGPWSVRFDDASVADFFDEMADQGYHPEQFARVWIHTHPGDSPEPSPTDEQTFDRCFGGCDWAVMFILAQDDSTYARLRFNVGPCGSIALRTDIDFDRPFGPSDGDRWRDEYDQSVRIEQPVFMTMRGDDPFEEDKLIAFFEEQRAQALANNAYPEDAWVQ